MVAPLMQKTMRMKVTGITNQYTNGIMRKKELFIIYCLCSINMWITSCCHEEMDSQSNPKPKKHIYHMRFDVLMQTFDSDTRTSVEWEDGARVYLTFIDGYDKVSGLASYDATNKEWTVYASKTISSSAGDCHAYYFASPTSVTTSQIGLSAMSPIYIDENAAYDIIDDLITINAKLVPKTGRIRFKGTTGQKFSVTGLSYYKGYTISSCNFASEELELSGIIEENGYSGFYYVFFTDEHSLVFNNTSTTCFKSSFGSNVLAAAQSGYITIPSADAPGYWTLVNKQSLQPITLPELGELEISQIRSTSAMITVPLLSTGNGTISSSGFIYSIYANPSTSNGITVTTKPSNGEISMILTDLEPETQYYVCSFATNEKGTTLGSSYSFSTISTAEDGTIIENPGYGDDENLDEADSSEGDIGKDDYGDDEDYDE